MACESATCDAMPDAMNEEAAQVALAAISKSFVKAQSRLALASPVGTSNLFGDVVTSLRAEGLSFWTILHYVADIMALIPQLGSVSAIVKAILALIEK